MKKSSRFWVEESFNKLNPRCWRVFPVQSHSSGLPFKVQTPSRFAYKVPGLIGMEALYKKAKFKILFPWAARGPSAGAQHSSKRHVKMETSSLTWWMVLVLEGGWVGGDGGGCDGGVFGVGNMSSVYVLTRPSRNRCYLAGIMCGHKPSSCRPRVTKYSPGHNVSGTDNEAHWYKTYFCHIRSISVSNNGSGTTAFDRIYQAGCSEFAPRYHHIWLSSGRIDCFWCIPD